MSATVYTPHSYVPVQKWEDRAELLLKDPDAFYAAVPPKRKATVKVWGGRKRKRHTLKWLMKR